MWTTFCSDLGDVEVPVERGGGPGQGGRDSLEVSEGLLARHTCKEVRTGQVVEGMQSPAGDSWWATSVKSCKYLANG